MVGVTAVRLNSKIPELRSEHVLEAIEIFAKFFIHFYLFKAGLHLESKYFSLDSLLLGFLFVSIDVPIRIFVVIEPRVYSLKEESRFGFRVGLSLVPTLVFTIVIADILLQEYNLSSELYGALIVFTLINTVLPGFILKAPPPEFDTPEAPEAKEDDSVVSK